MKIFSNLAVRLRSHNIVTNDINTDPISEQRSETRQVANRVLHFKISRL